MKEDVNLIKKLLGKYKNKLKICLLLATVLQMDRKLYFFKPIFYWHVMSRWRILKSVSILLLLLLSNVIKWSIWW
jgi:hypothetical protein